MKLVCAATATALCALAATVAADPKAAPPTWDFVVTIADLHKGQLEIDWTLHGFTSPVTVRADIAGGERGVRDLRAVDPTLGPTGSKPLAPDPDFPKEWIYDGALSDGSLHLAYRYDLSSMAGRSGDPDYVARDGDDFVFTDEAVLLRPDPLPDDAILTVEFRLPPGVSVVTPWDRLPGDGFRFRTDAHQYDCGSYFALGRLADLGDVKVRGGSVHLVVLDHPRAMPNQVLKKWVERAASSVADFYDGMPGGRQLLVLMPIDTASASVFGTTMRRGHRSVALLFGANAPDSAFDHEAMLTHELFHTGNPPVEGKLPWAVEGITTYYEQVLLARRGEESAAATWGDLRETLMRRCDPAHGRSLAEESRRLPELHNYPRVYWGGACVALQLDVAIRKHSGNKQSLDDVLRALHRGTDEISEDELIATLDHAAGTRMVRALLDTTQSMNIERLFKDLGVERVSESLARLRDDAPLAAIRKSMF